jgi:hypothetical protein
MALLDSVLTNTKTLADQFVALALFLLGHAYTWGDEPWFVVGGAVTADPYDADCSGVVYGLFRKLGVHWSNGAEWPRLTANGYYHSTVAVAIKDLRAGDIFSFVDINDHAYHTGVVIGMRSDGHIHTVEARGSKWGIVDYSIDDPVNGIIHRGGHFRRFAWVNLGTITPPVAPPKPPAPPLPNYPTLHRGDINATVKILQTKLVAKGYKDSRGKALVVDGNFGANTLYAVEQFQMHNKDVNGVKLVVDGEVGPKTWAILQK